MNIYVFWIVVVFLISVVCGFIFIPIILNFCKEKQLYDIPNARKIHNNAIPRLGGVAFMPSMFIAFAIAVAVMNSTSRLVTINVWSLCFMFSIMLIYAMGIVDDVLGLSPMVKFAVQVVAACMLPLSCLYINDFYGFMGLHGIPYAIGFPLTVLVIVFIDNAINLIDGIDGLAASLVIIALAGFLYMFAWQGVWSYAILISGLIGVLVSFLYFNLFGNAAKNRKVFMGDAGSLTLGFILGVLSVKISMYNPNVLPVRYFDFIAPFTLLIVPMFDVVRVFIVRIWHGGSPFKADKRHIHHKFMRAGLTQHKALCCIVVMAVVFILANYYLLEVMANTYVLLIDVVVYVVLNLVLNRLILKKERRGVNLVSCSVGNGH